MTPAFFMCAALLWQAAAMARTFWIGLTNHSHCTAGNNVSGLILPGVPVHHNLYELQL